VVQADLAGRKIARAEAWLAEVAELLGGDATAGVATVRRFLAAVGAASRVAPRE
jgi:hypothetical protein